MKIVPFEPPQEKREDADSSGVSERQYGELFFAADWAVRNRPWERCTSEDEGPFFELSEEGKWQAFLSEEAGYSLFLLVLNNGEEAETRLEIRFVGSNFLQGYDYELNVRYAPDSWDACEYDVIVLRASEGEEAPERPKASQVELLTRGLRALETHCLA